MASQKVEWLGVEVVTDKPEKASEIRGKIPLVPHSKLGFPDDPRYKQWCETVRAAYPRATTSCSPLLMEAARGYYVVQVEFDPKPVGTRTCEPGAPGLRPSLRALADRFMSLLQQSLMGNAQGGTPYREFINDKGHIDYADPLLHEFAVSAHDQVSAHLAEVLAATSSCDATGRAAALQLMNWSGDVAASIRVGSVAILDEDGGVRNSATRLVGVFIGHLNSSISTAPLVVGLCTQLAYTSFTDRDKAVNALLALGKL